VLRRPFEQLTLEDVRAIAAGVGDERETLFFEQKLDVSPNALAKSCAAFANSLGGLLVVGADDDTGELVGIEPKAAEAQLWVKDILRELVLPLPPFRARWLPLDDGNDRGVLIVLIEQSSTTPHLLTRRGAIYVRNPGSSDPAPLADQRLLLELTTRGQDARATAQTRADGLLNDVSGGRLVSVQALAAAATGVGSYYTAQLFRRATPELVALTFWDAKYNSDLEGRQAEWLAQSLRVTRQRLNAFHDFITEPVVVWESGGAACAWGIEPRHRNGYEGETTRHEEAVGEWILEQLGKLRDLLLELGAHGDLAITYGVDLSAGFQTVEGHHQVGGPGVRIERWTTLDVNEHGDALLRDSILDEIRRRLGFPPRQ
jgi:hypothetical protein